VKRLATLMLACGLISAIAAEFPWPN